MTDATIYETVGTVDEGAHHAVGESAILVEHPDEDVFLIAQVKGAES